MHIGIERRKNKRLKYRSPILHSTIPPDFFYRGDMYNCSIGGLYFESNEDLLQGDEISMSIKDPPQEIEKTPGQYFDVRIMWSMVLQGSRYQIGYGAKII